jgi:glycosyltransferase involved in cell wall biosynthesis
MGMKQVVVYGVKTFPSQGGTDRVAENLILQLKEKFQITVYCYKNHLASTYIPGIKVIQFVPVTKGALGAFIYFLTSAMHLLFTQKAHLVHVHKTDSAFFVPLLRLRFRVIATSHEAPYKRDKWNRFVKMYFHLVERIFINTSHLCTSISKPLTDYYEHKYGKPVLFIPNGINPTQHADENVENAKMFLPPGATLDEPYILFSARRIMSTKGCHTMLAALAKIGYTGQVFIAGELTHNSNYLSELRRIGKPLNMHFLGFVNPLSTLLSLVKNAELFVFPSETEGMSIMLLEVASAGKAIVASDIPENTQVFNESEVLYFKVNNVDDLADKIRYALDHKEEMKALGQRCQEKVFSKYVWKNIANAYAEAYETVMN